MATDLAAPTTIPELPPASVADRGLTPKAARRWAWAERLLYGTGGVVTAIGPHMGNPLVRGIGTGLAAGALAGTAWWLWKRSEHHHHTLLVSCTRAVPLIGYAGTWLALQHIPGRPWWEYAIPAALTGLMGWWVPLTRSVGLRRVVARLEDPELVFDDEASVWEDEEPEEEDGLGFDPTTFEGYLKARWALSPTTAGTTLEQIHQHDPDAPDFDAVIVAKAGQAVPRTVDRRTVAAVFDVPETVVELKPVPGSGPGRLALSVTPSQIEEDIEAAGLQGLWERKVSGAGGAAPGMRMIDHQIGEDRIRILVEADEDRLIALPRRKLARALQVDDPDLLMVETDGMARGVVTVYREHPLINVPEPTIEDLTMDERGMITIGVRHDGRPFKMALYDPELGAMTDLAVGAPGAGKSVFLNLLLIAERASGVVSIVADAQNGMSLPEAKGRVYSFATGLAGVAATLAAICALADYREQVSTANGWGGFKIGDPWRLVNVTIDEINLVLGAQAAVPPEFRKWCTGMIARGQQTGRKFGEGVRFAGQSIHVTDLGDAEKIRANAKQGTVWMGRVNSSTTRQMALDMVTDGTEISSIPMYFGGGQGDVESAWSGAEAPRGPVTAGMAWALQGGRATLMRVFKVIKENRTFPKLIELYEARPMPVLTEPEDAVFQAAYKEGYAIAEALLAGESGGGDGDGDEEDGGRKRRKKTAAVPTTPRPTVAIPAPPKSLRDQVLDALADGMPHPIREIRSAVGVGTPDGPSVDSVANAVSKLAASGQLVQASHGVWRLAPPKPANED
ncbi:hypothetical protein [Kitasatospora sp. HPMI-4]|uniref:hypothetical protein n=1 Tax=Kitasatospora sp. HPMI-4 TaxID=3448443 RepID=UPI003F1B9740